MRDHPIARRPAFMALLRQNYLQVRAQQPEAFPAFRAVFNDLFWVLHRLAYEDACQRSSQGPAPDGEPRPDPFIPDFHRQVLEILDGRLPPLAGPPADPATELEEVRQALASLSGSPPDLPEYAPSPGARWALLGVECPRCGLEYPVVRAHLVDLVAEPGLEEAALEGRLNVPGCPNCAEPCARPLGVFIEDPPFAGDPLASLTCAWRLSPDFFVYQPPPGTWRQPDWDRILEVRFSQRVEELGWTDEAPVNEEGAVVTSMSVAYSSEELQAHVRGRAGQAEVPRAMQVAIDDIAGKLRSGMLPVHQAEEQIRNYAAVAGDWPLIAAPPPAAAGSHVLEGLTQALIVETAAEVQAAQLAARVMLAVSVANYYLALNEPAAAERAVARAVDLFAEVPADDDLRRPAEAALIEVRAELFDALGQHAEAERLRREEDLADVVEEGTFAARAVAASRRERAALSSFEQGRLAEALEAYPDCIDELRELLDEGEDRGDPEERAWVESVRHNLSGAIANYASALVSVADHVEASTRFHAGEEAGAIAEDLGVDVERSLARVEELRPLLRQQFPDGFAAELLRWEAAQLFLDALGMAESLDAWDFAAVQAHHLMWIAHRQGEARDAAEFAERAIQYAERCGDHVRHWTARNFLAERCLERNDGVAALAQLEDAALGWMRDAIGRGHHVRADPAVPLLGGAVLRAVDAGANPARAVLVLESLKAATTASSLATGFPIRPAADAPGELADRVEEAHRLRESLRLEMMWSPDDADLRTELQIAAGHLSELRRELSLRDPSYAEWVDASDVQLSDVAGFRRRLKSLGPSTRLLGLFVTPDALWSYVTGGPRTSLSSHPLEDLGDFQTFDEPSLARLAQTILEPLADELEGLGPDDRLLVSPDFGFFHVPFAALPFDGQPLCARATLSFVQGAGVLEAVLGRARPDYSRVAAVGGPERPDWSDLPGAKVEAERISELFPDPQPPRVGAEATVAALAESLGDVDVLHIACHGASSGPDDEQARLLLAPDLRGGDSGVLSEDRILAELAVPEGCLVNLAGCSTAAQRRAEGPLLGGLVPAFLVAGAGSVLAAVRPIADGEATAFQENFYRNLLAGSTPADSLAACQRACLRGELGAELADVGAWAFYVLYGTG